MSEANTKIGFRKDREVRKKTTEGSVTVKPENKEEQERTLPDKIFKTPKKKGYSGDYPKSLRASLETHTAIATIATMQDINKYEALDVITEAFIEQLTPTQQKLIRNSIKQVLEIKKAGGKV
ncbi:hypothetical protein [Bacillus fungorum]|uniref:hypothetical protein n=1 Tax=Bacillus fungorum TaxID=2039284 RepID=UPI003F55E2A6